MPALQEWKEQAESYLGEIVLEENFNKDFTERTDEIRCATPNWVQSTACSIPFIATPNSQVGGGNPCPGCNP